MFFLQPTDPDVIKFKNACTAAGTILTSLQINALDEMVKRLKSTGIWQKCKAIYPFIGGTAGAHKFNLVNPVDADAAYRLVFVGAPTHSSNGIAWNGTTQYADTFLSPVLALGQNDSHISYYSRSNTGAADTEIGIYHSITGGGLYLNINYSGTEYKAINSMETTGATGLGTSSQGMFTGSRVNATQEFHKRAGLAVSTSTKNSVLGTFLAGNIYIGAVNTINAGIPDAFTNKAVAFASIGNGLTSAQLDLFYTIVQNYQTRLGRQV